jgi:salicylate hydroxylase
VDVPKGKPVILQKLIQRDWKTGEALNVYDLADYKDKWGFVSGLVS